jgi:hypothetical protein
MRWEALVVELVGTGDSWCGLWLEMVWAFCEDIAGLITPIAAEWRALTCSGQLPILGEG